MPLPQMSLLRASFCRPVSSFPLQTCFRRNFSRSTVTMGKQEWLAILPDKAGALSQRMEVRPQHLDATKPHVDAGFLVLGGATLDEPAKEGQPLKINGSVMMLSADTEEEVRAWIKNDVYFKNGVWDESEIKIIPFKSAFRKEL